MTQLVDSPGDRGCAAWRRLAPRLLAAGIRRIVLVGGTPIAAREVARWAADHGVEVRPINGTRRHTARQATSNIGWGDRFVVWGSSPLAHRVSRFYRPQATHGGVPRRSPSGRPRRNGPAR